jgi:hypothetical protein
MFKSLVAGIAVGSLALTCLACNTTKATMDTTVKFFSSTSPEEMFTVDGLVEPKQKVKLFSGVAYDNLRDDIARGDGEYLTSLGTLLNVAPGDRDEFGAFVQSKYHTLFASDLTTDRTAHTMLAALNREWEANQIARKGTWQGSSDGAEVSLGDKNRGARTGEASPWDP